MQTFFREKIIIPVYGERPTHTHALSLSLSFRADMKPVLWWRQSPRSSSPPHPFFSFLPWAENGGGQNGNPYRGSNVASFNSCFTMENIPPVSLSSLLLVPSCARTILLHYGNTMAATRESGVDGINKISPCKWPSSSK